MMPRAHLARYGLWQLRDYFLNRGLPTFIVTILGAYVTLIRMLGNVEQQMKILPPRLIARYGGVAGARLVLMRDVNTSFLISYLGVAVFLSALFAVNGIVSDDRKKGYYRFLFAKPMSPSRYYGQAFLIHWIGFVVVVCALALLYGLIFVPLLTSQLLFVVALTFLMYAGIGFALSAAARWDWLTLVAATVFADFLWFRFGPSTSVLARLLYLLPPVHRTQEVYIAVANHNRVDAGLLLWIAGYGIVCYVIGLVVLRRRRLAIV